MERLLVFILVFGFSFVRNKDCACVYQKKENIIRSGEIWPDNRGQHINAHGGGILYHEGKYYWFGEHRSGDRSPQAGVTCYSSTNLCNWMYEGLAFTVSGDLDSEVARGCTIERPKVIYNAQTGKFVMWFHHELKGKGYEAARAVVAVGDTPVGPYRFVRSDRVNPGIYPDNMTKKERDMMKKKYLLWSGRAIGH